MKANLKNTYGTVVADLEGANTGLHIIERVVAVLIGDQLAVDITHGVFLRHLVEDDLRAGDVSNERLGD